jgi:hypothetical protein
MLNHNADKYECVQENETLKGYLEHYREVSKNNEIPGLLSFFFIQGQCALPYVRIPIGGSNIDPRVSVFWIQDTRTGKSVAFEIIQRVMKDAGLECIDYTTGTDAAMVGSFNRDQDGTVTQTPGALAGRKGMNFDEGSILLKPSQHSEATVLFLQSALNSAGTGRNILTKHMKDGTISIKSEVSLWITTFPPDGIKDYVLDKGIFQRVLLYWREWTMDMKQDVWNELIDAIHNKPKFTVSYDGIVQHFTDLEKRLKKRVCDLNELSILQWDEAEEDTCEAWTMKVMRQMFSIAPDFKPALKAAVQDYTALLEHMDPKKQSVCSSFIMGLLNYTNVLAHHMAMLEGTWTVTGVHVDMAREILFDLYQNLIHWLESKVQVGESKSERRTQTKMWREAFSRCETIDFDDNRGRGWVRVKNIKDVYGQMQNLQSDSTIRERFRRVTDVFERTRVGSVHYVRMKPEGVAA